MASHLIASECLFAQVGADIFQAIFSHPKSPRPFSIIFGRVAGFLQLFCNNFFRTLLVKLFVVSAWAFPLYILFFPLFFFFFLYTCCAILRNVNWASCCIVSKPFASVSRPFRNVFSCHLRLKANRTEPNRTEQFVFPTHGPHLSGFSIPELVSVFYAVCCSN